MPRVYWNRRRGDEERRLTEILPPGRGARARHDDTESCGCSRLAVQQAIRWRARCRAARAIAATRRCSPGEAGVRTRQPIRRALLAAPHQLPQAASWRRGLSRARLQRARSARLRLAGSRRPGLRLVPARFDGLARRMVTRRHGSLAALARRASGPSEGRVTSAIPARRSPPPPKKKIRIGSIATRVPSSRSEQTTRDPASASKLRLPHRPTDAVIAGLFPAPHLELFFGRWRSTHRWVFRPLLDRRANLAASGSGPTRRRSSVPRARCGLASARHKRA